MLSNTMGNYHYRDVNYFEVGPITTARGAWAVEYGSDLLPRTLI
jgi:hypothetical protein